MPADIFGPMAQRLEQGTHNPLVAGSNPARPTRSNMRSIRYRSHFFQCMIFRDMCRFRGYLNRYDFPRRLQLRVPEKIAILSHVSRCAVSGYFKFGMHNTRCVFSPLAFLSTALSRVRTGRLLPICLCYWFSIPSRFFFSARRRYRCPLDGEPPLDGHFFVHIPRSDAVYTDIIGKLAAISDIINSEY